MVGDSDSSVGDSDSLASSLIGAGPLLVPDVRTIVSLSVALGYAEHDGNGKGQPEDRPFTAICLALDGLTPSISSTRSFWLFQTVIAPMT